MLDELLEKKLKDLNDKDILVVMDDGLAFLGKLVDFDKNTIILKEVYQAPAKKINWKAISQKSGETRKDIEKEQKIGYIDWTKVNLEEVYVRVDHVTRIWRWYETESKKSKKKKRKKVERPVYVKGQEIPDERMMSIGDIKDTFPG